MWDVTQCKASNHAGQQCSCTAGSHRHPARRRPMSPQDRMGRVVVSGLLLGSHAMIWETVMRIPPGSVASYGQVAREAGLPGRARLVGQVLRRLPPGLEVPWHRVVNASGRISLPGEAGRAQAGLLQREGVHFVRGRIDLKHHRWSPSPHPRGGRGTASNARRRSGSAR